MNRDGHEAVSMFVGTEVEHSPAFGQRTLFVIGVQDSTDIIAEARDMPVHTYTLVPIRAFPG
jgi:hypothetical protein